VAYDSDAQAIIDAWELADGLPLAPLVKDAIDALIVGMKADPSPNSGVSNYDACKSLWLSAGPATLAGSLVSAKGASPTNIGFTFANHSQQFGLHNASGTKSLNANRLDNADPQDNHHHAVWLSKSLPPGNNNASLMGSTPSQNSILYRSITLGGVVQQVGTRSRSGTNSNSASTGLPGLYGHSRNASGSYTAIGGGTTATITRESTTPAASPVTIFTYGGAPLGKPVVAAYSIGEAVDLAAMHSRIATYMETLADAGPGELNTISYKRIIQRTGTHGDFAVSGFYLDTDTASVEIMVVNAATGTTVLDWTDAGATVTDGEWSGSVSVPVGGPYTAVARFKDAGGDVISSTVAGVETFIVGDVFVAMGQSNTVGAGTNKQTYNGTAAAWIVRKEDEILELLTDPWAVEDAGGGWGPILGSLIDAGEGVPMVFITKAASSMGLSPPSPHFLPPDGSMWLQADALVDSLGINGLAAVLWFQGERDSLNEVSKADYEANEKLLASSVAEWPGSPPMVVSLHGYNTNSASGLDAVRAAKIANWDDASTIAGANTIDIDLSDEGGDGLHFKTDAELTTVAARMWLAVEDLLYDGTNGRGPRLSSATYSGTDVVLVFDRDLDADDTTYTATAFAVDNAGSDAVTVSSATRTGAREVTLVCSGGIDSETPTVSFGSQNSAGGATIPKTAPIALPKTIHSISSVAIPAEPFYAQAMTEVVEPDPPVLTTITVNPASATVTVGGTQQFTATTLDQHGDPIETDPVEWSADNGTIDEAGLYTAPETAGSATITAAIGEIAGTASVTVEAPTTTTTTTTTTTAEPTTTTTPATGTAVYPDPSTVLINTQYGPNGNDYTGTLSPGSGGGVTGPGGIPVIIPVTSNNQPVDGVAVWITTDPEGTNQIAGVLYTNTFGNTEAFTLEAGIFYVWVQKAGINFTNPQSIQVLENGTYQWYTG
jgi:hypothetical protein